MRQSSLALLLIFAVFPLSACRDRGAENRKKVIDSREKRSCRQFVQSFYDWYFEKLNAEEAHETADSADAQLFSQRLELLTPELTRMLQQDYESSRMNSDDIVGLDFDPFINAQDWNGKYTVKSTEEDDGACRASVWGDDAGKQKEIVVPELKKSGDHWVFVNFHYPGNRTPADENLVATLTALQKEREGNAHRSSGK